MKKIVLCLSSLLLSLSAVSQAGSIDPTFQIGAGCDNLPFAITLQADGKILVGGGFQNYNNLPQNYIMRLNPNGSIDPSFSIGTGFDYNVNAIAVQSDGKVLVGGGFYNYNGTTSKYLIRLNPNGTADPTFSVGTGFNSNVQDIKIQPDGKILVCGNFTTYNGSGQVYITRLNSDGTLDTGFSPGGVGFGAAGSFPGIYSMALQPDGNILVGGQFGTFNGIAKNRIARLTTTGADDPTFIVGSGFTGGTSTSVNSLALQSNGKIIAAGTFTAYAGNARNHITRINQDGSLDNTFNVGTGFTGSSGSGLLKITLQPDGKIIAGFHTLTAYNGNPVASVCRIDTTGSLDNSITFSLSTYGNIYSIAVQPDNKIILGGGFSFYGTSLMQRLVRLNGDLVTGIKPNELKTDMEVYPNPASEFVKVELPEFNQTHITITNSIGQTIYTASLTEEETRIETRNFSKGLYLVKLQTKTSERIVKLVIQ